MEWPLSHILIGRTAIQYIDRMFQTTLVWVWRNLLLVEDKTVAFSSVMAEYFSCLNVWKQPLLSMLPNLRLISTTLAAHLDLAGTDPPCSARRLSPLTKL